MAARAVFSHVCDATTTGAGNDKWTANTNSGTGVAVVADAANKYEGAASLRYTVTAGAGGSFSSKTLVVTRGLNTTTRVSGAFMINDDTTPATAPAQPTIPAQSVQIIALENAAAGQGIAVYLQNQDGATGKKFTLRSSVGGSFSDLTDDGVSAGVFHTFVVYVGVAEGANGWAQLWLDGALVGELSGIDTYPGAALDRFRVGQIWRGDNNIVGTIWFDGIVIDSGVPATNWPSGMPYKLASWPAADDTEWDGTQNIGGASATYPAGVTTNALAVDVSGGATQQVWNLSAIPAQASGAYLHGIWYPKLVDGGEAEAKIPRILRIENAATSEGLVIRIETPATGAGFRVWIGNSSDVGFYSTNRYTFADFTPIEWWSFLHGTAGRLALEVNGTAEGAAGGLNTLPNGTLDTVYVGQDAGGDDNMLVTSVHDDLTVDGEVYPAWASRVPYALILESAI